jgi:hypothetical protein
LYANARSPPEGMGRVLLTNAPRGPRRMPFFCFAAWGRQKFGLGGPGSAPKSHSDLGGGGLKRGRKDGAPHFREPSPQKLSLRLYATPAFSPPPGARRIRAPFDVVVATQCYAPQGLPPPVFPYSRSEWVRGGGPRRMPAICPYFYPAKPQAGYK